MNFDNTYVKIDLDAIEANFDAIRAKAGVDVMAVVKADAYGHGVDTVARVLGDAGCGFFAVSSEEEALSLREIETKILTTPQKQDKLEQPKAQTGTALWFKIIFCIIAGIALALLVVFILKYM